VSDEEIDRREFVSTVLAAAEAYAKDRRTEEQKALLGEVSEIVTDLGKRLGVAQLESATLQGNTHLPVVKGGAKASFGSLTEGERLRLKIAVVIALLDVGTSAGVGRHPGLLVIDSIGREELNPADVKTLLRELEAVAREHDVQVITSTTYGDVAIEALETGAVVLPIDGEVMW
jgi:ABC-type ATPase with predicted acetyltransferase domain